MAHSDSPTALDFLRDFEISDDLFRNVSWRESDFSEAVWRCKFGDTRSSIDFRVKLDDGSLLTGRRHARLLESIRMYLCMQTHPYWTRGRTLNSKTEGTLVSTAVHVVNYFLLRSALFRISTNGFSAILKEDIARFVAAAGAQKQIKASLYNVEEELVHFFQRCSPVQATHARSWPHGLFDIDVERILPLSDDEIRRARGYLWERGFYTFATKDKRGSRYRVRGQALLQEIYRDRVIGNLKFDDLPLGDLDFGSSSAYARELPHVPVHSQREVELASEESVVRYTRALRAMSLGADHGYALIDTETLSALDNRALIESLKTKKRGRVVTLDFGLTSKALRNAIALASDYGEDLVDSYLACASAAKSAKKRLSKMKDIKKLVRPRIRALGVKRWRLPTKDGTNQYTRLRNNEGLFELLLVLYGSIIVIVNSLMARRIEELVSVEANSWRPGPSGWYLRFHLGKANVGDLRTIVERPLPNIGARVLDLLKRLQVGLAAVGFDNRSYSIFATPHFSQARLCKTSDHTINTCLDHFCDYMQTATDSAGRRYYIRSHQLRRNFAMLFFWPDPQGSLEVLRWFFGHLKASHIYRYICEICPGAVLRQVKSERVAYDVTRRESSAQALSELLSREYGISDVSVMPASDVADYVESLVIEGRVQIEPKFFELSNGEECYKVLITIKETKDE